jgi:hypothetical protein
MNSIEYPNYKNFRIEKLNQERVKDLVYLTTEIYTIQIDEESISKKHLNCHGENKFLGFLAYDLDSGEPAAYYGVFPGFLSYKEKIHLVAQSGDTMTNPKFQKQGLFVHLAKITFEYCKKIGIEIITGLPNNNSYHGFIRYLNFDQFSTFKNLTFHENKYELTRVFKASNVLRKIHLSYAKGIINLFSKNGEKPKNSNRFNKDLAYMVHDEEFYKLKLHPNNKFIRIKGVNVWIRLEQNNISIADIGQSSPDQIKKIIKRLKIILLLSGYRFLNFGATPNSELHSRLASFAKYQSQGYTFIALILKSEIELNQIALLNSDADVF